eukprot:473450-Prorocentrum_minimum.AAC.3
MKRKHTQNIPLFTRMCNCLCLAENSFTNFCTDSRSARSGSTRTPLSGQELPKGCSACVHTVTCVSAKPNKQQTENALTEAHRLRSSLALLRHLLSARPGLQDSPAGQHHVRSHFAQRSGRLLTDARIRASDDCYGPGEVLRGHVRTLQARVEQERHS